MSILLDCGVGNMGETAISFFPKKRKMYQSGSSAGTSPTPNPSQFPRIKSNLKTLDMRPVGRVGVLCF